MFKNYIEWVNEDFAMAGSVPGMGDATPPTETSVGSGDTWPSLGEPASLIPLSKSKDLCPTCGNKAVSRCRCSKKIKHTLASLRKGHGMCCENGHRWSYNTNSGALIQFNK